MTGLVMGRITLFSLDKFWNCSVKILNKFPLLELSSAVIYLGIFYLFGINLAAIFYSLLFSSLLVITLTDLKYYLIPNSIVFGLLILGLAFHLTTRPFNFLNAALSFILAGVFFLILQIFSGGGMGGGDIKLISILGLWFGFPGIALIIFISALIGSVIGIILIMMKFKNRKQGLPFGPFIVFATLIVFLVGDQIWALYLKAF
ncbi:prepilin peptidase [Desulfonispora thiosulfatigenes]|nr:A24 family peptidase [Desulfonispora thiosulfatigenes]